MKAKHLVGLGMALACAGGFVFMTVRRSAAPAGAGPKDEPPAVPVTAAGDIKTRAAQPALPWLMTAKAAADDCPDAEAVAGVYMGLSFRLALLGRTAEADDAFYAAIARIGRIPDLRTRYRSFHDLAWGQKSAGRQEHAQNIAAWLKAERAVPGSGIKPDAGDLTALYVRMGDLDQARNIVKDNVDATVDLAKSLTSVKQREMARDLVFSARDMAMQERDPKQQWDQELDVAVAMHDQGLDTEALELLQRFNAHPCNGHRFSDAAAQQVAGMLHFADWLRQDKRHADVLTLLSRAHTLAKAIPETSPERRKCLVDIGSAMARSGDLEGAYRLKQESGDGWGIDLCVFLWYLEERDFPAAKDAISKISHEGARRGQFTLLAQFLCGPGVHEEDLAQQLLDELQADKKQNPKAQNADRVRVAIMRLQAKLGQVEAAMAHPEAEKDQDTLKMVCDYYLRRKELYAAETVAGQMAEKKEFWRFCSERVAAFLKEKDYDSAMTCIALHDDGLHWIKYDVAAALAKNGEMSRAKDWAAAQPRPLDRACASLGVAHGIMQAADMIPP